MRDYDRIAHIIRYLDKYHINQPDLGTLAKEVGLSPYHFHRLFADWAGITPKDFLQCLTFSHAKDLLAQGQTITEAALESGLSGPSRLHDLCVTLEAASPGELKSGGEGWTITAGFADSPFGQCLVARGPRGLCYLSFIEPGHQSAAWKELKSSWPRAILQRDDHAATMMIARIFRQSGRRPSTAPLRAFIKGTPFQVRVWRALLQVPPGHITSYGQLAKKLGKPSAARAVGSAVGQNCLAYLIPCHRVIRETGIIGDYRWGPVRKRAILAWECAHNPQSLATPLP